MTLATWHCIGLHFPFPRCGTPTFLKGFSLWSFVHDHVVDPACAVWYFVSCFQDRQSRSTTLICIIPKQEWGCFGIRVVEFGLSFLDIQKIAYCQNKIQQFWHFWPVCNQLQSGTKIRIRICKNALSRRYRWNKNLIWSQTLSQGRDERSLSRAPADSALADCSNFFIFSPAVHRQIVLIIIWDMPQCHVPSSQDGCRILRYQRYRSWRC